MGSRARSSELATVIAGVLVMIGVVVAGGAIYDGLQKIADALTKKE